MKTVESCWLSATPQSFFDIQENIHNLNIINYEVLLKLRALKIKTIKTEDPSIECRIPVGGFSDEQPDVDHMTTFRPHVCRDVKTVKVSFFN